MRSFLLIWFATSLLMAQQWQRVENQLTGSSGSFNGIGHSWGDIDGDGDPDLIVNGSQELWINQFNANGSFENGQALMPNTGFGSGWAACFGDFDNDGDPDLFFGNSGTDFLIQNNWPNNFTSVGPQYDLTDEDWCQSINWVDYNKDGKLDIYITHELPDGDGPHEFYQNDYPNAFIPKFPQGAGPDTFGLADLNSHAYGLTWADIDIDGDIDAVTSACGSSNTIPGENPHNKMYINNHPTEGFTDVSLAVGLVDANEVSAGSASYWATLFDYNGDEFPDLSIGSTGGSHRLWVNTGANPGDVSIDLVPNSVHNTAGSGAFVDGACVGDWDNDGDLDFYSTPDGLFENDGSGGFIRRSDLVPSGGSDASFVDYNMDGQLDLFNQNDLWENPGNDNHWISVELDGDPTAGTTRSAHHVKISVTAGGKTYYREHRHQVGSYSQHMLPTHFGLAQADMVDNVTVTWPDGSTTELNNLDVDQYIYIKQNADCSGTLNATETTFFGCQGSQNQLSVNVSNSESIRWRVISGPSTDPSQFSDPTLPNPVFTSREIGNYTLGVTFEGCPQTQIMMHTVDGDFNGNGTYDVNDFLSAMEPWASQSNIELFDVDGSGSLDIKDMMSFCYFIEN